MVTLPRDGIRRRPETKLGQHYLGKPKRCTICKAVMIAPRAGQKVCGGECAEALVEKARRIADKAAVLADKRETRAKLERLKTRGQWVHEAQTAVNRVARLRDIHAGHGCISCGAPYQGRFGGAFDGGHYRSVGAAPHLRFYLPQISLQCVKCNRYLGGNATEARKGLIVRRGVAWVESVEAMQGDGKWSIPYLQRLKKIMTRLAGRLERRIAAKGLA